MTVKNALRCKYFEEWCVMCCVWYVVVECVVVGYATLICCRCGVCCVWWCILRKCEMCGVLCVVRGV